MRIVRTIKTAQVHLQWTRYQMRFEYKFRLEPRGIFGLNEPDWMVTPAGVQITSPVLDARTGNLVLPGTQSILRDLEHQVTTAGTLEPLGEYSLTDNVLTLTVGAAEELEAIPRGVALLNAVLPLISFTLETNLSVHFIQGVDEQGGRAKFLMRGTFLRGRFYNINLANDALAAVSRRWDAGEREPRLKVAVTYYIKGLQLESSIYDLETTALRPLEATTNPLSAEAFLNFWKVLEVILGGSTDSAAFKKRTSNYSLDAEFVTKLVNLYGLRDSADVAHAQGSVPSVSPDDVLTAKRAARQVIDAVVETLAPQSQKAVEPG